MLKPKALTRLLASTTGNGVTSTLLLQNDGVLLAYSGDSGYAETNATVSAAIGSQIWRNFEKQGADALHGDHLQTIIIECENGKVALRRTAHLLIAMCATASTSTALLKMKIEALADYLAAPLSQLNA